MTFRRSAATLFLLAAVAVPPAALATIAPFKVNSISDTAGQDCTNPANTCTLRGAIAQAAALGVAQEIDLPGVPNTGDVTTYTVGSTLPTITNNDITIVGNSPATTIIKSSGGTIFNLTGGSLTLSHAEITGASSGEGIVSANANVTLDHVLLDGTTRTAVHVSGTPPSVIPTLTLTNSTISNNSTFLGGAGVVQAEFATMIATNDLFDTNTSTGGGSAFYHHGLGSITITGSTFNNNKTTNGGSGAAIAGDGTSMGIQSCTFTNNTASGNGGAVDAAVTDTTIDNSTFDSNTAGDAMHPASGGGLFTGYSVTITKSTFSNNSATQLGGGAFAGGNFGAMITATNCTFSGNTAGQGGGALANGSGASGQFILSNVTIANNTATTGGGGGIQMNSLASFFKNTIIAGNSGSPGPDCNGTMITEDYNLVGDGSGCQINPANGITMPHDLVGTAMNPIDAGLDPMGLMANGSSGPLTLALTPSSPAGDAANPNGCRDHANIPITTDERGDPRPVDGNCDNVARCDIGAFEAAKCTLTPPTTTTTTSTTTSTTTTSTSTTATTSSSTTTTHAPPTTTSTTTPTTTTTTSSTTTTHAPTTTTSPTTTTTSSSTTTTTYVPTTTTTLPAGNCDSEPVAATFASIDCRLVALLARVTTESDLGASGPKLVQNLSSAKAAEEAGASACAASDLKHASHGLRQAIRDMIGYAHHLQTLRARKNLPGALRTDLLAAGNPITDDAKSLKRTVQCPADAPQ